MKQQILTIGLLGLGLGFMMTSCKDKEPIITPGPSTGKTIQLNGIVGSESGSNALNSVFVDFSTDVSTTLRRDGWDLGFYGGDKNRVIINFTSAATAIVTDKTDINAVGIADTVGKKTALSMMDMSPSDMNLIDDIDGDLTKTVIPEVKTSGNKVVIINRGTGNGIESREYYKILIELLPSGHYKLTYAPLDATTSQSIEISKDKDFNFQLFSFDNGLVEKPMKSQWDIMWTASIYKTNMGMDEVPYAFSDMVAINYLAGTQVVEKNYDDEIAASTAYENYTSSDLSKETFSHQRWYIGSHWRKTATPGSTTPAGTIKTKFYIIKDSEGNAYKLKFISFSSDDGGERGRPEIKYQLL